MLPLLRRILFGRPLASRRARHERLPKLLALPVFASDALSSSAYATEEMLLVLWMAGGAALSLNLPITGCIVTLLAIVIFSYRQTVHAYPEGGGAFTVARENLGPGFGLTAAASLLIGYLLTVAVSIAAGAAAVASAFPNLQEHKTLLCLLFIGLITVANLRGAKESGTLFAPPTYGFVAVILFMVGFGAFRYFTGSVEPLPPRDPPDDLQPLGFFLILTAFARGCAALTGTEAISNGVQAFKPPEAKNAAATLALMGIMLSSLFAGISWLANTLGATPSGGAHGGSGETLVSMIARMVFGGSGIDWFYYVIQAATALILILAANTAYVDFPRLSSILARNGYAPRQLSNVGDRLVFTNGILVLGILSGGLLWLVEGDTHALIPLYALGVFISFTLSQAGMVVRWYRVRGDKWKLYMAINGFGALSTAVVSIVQLAVNFKSGSWAIAITIALLVLALTKVKRHYDQFRRELSIEGYQVREKLNARVVVLAPRLDRGVAQAIEFARTIAEPEHVIALHVNIDPQAPSIYRRVVKRGPNLEAKLQFMHPAAQRLQDEWATKIKDIPLTIIDSEYRSLVAPVIEYLDKLIEEEKLDKAIVVIPEFHAARAWHNLLHNQSGLMLKLALLNKPNVVVTNVRYRLSR